MALSLLPKNSLKVVFGQARILLLLKQLHEMCLSRRHKNQMNLLFVSNFRNGNPHLGKALAFQGIHALQRFLGSIFASPIFARL